MGEVGGRNKPSLALASAGGERGRGRRCGEGCGHTGRGALGAGPGRVGAEGSSRPVPGLRRCPGQAIPADREEEGGSLRPCPRWALGSAQGSRAPPRHLRSARLRAPSQALGLGPPTHAGEKGGAPRLNPAPGAASARGGEGSGLGGWRGSQPVPGVPSAAAAAAARTAEVAAPGLPMPFQRCFPILGEREFKRWGKHFSWSLGIAFTCSRRTKIVEQCLLTLLQR